MLSALNAMTSANVLPVASSAPKTVTGTTTAAVGASPLKKNTMLMVPYATSTYRAVPNAMRLRSLVPNVPYWQRTRANRRVQARTPELSVHPGWRPCAGAPARHASHASSPPPRAPIVSRSTLWMMAYARV